MLLNKKKLSSSRSEALPATPAASSAGHLVASAHPRGSLERSESLDDRCGDKTNGFLDVVLRGP